MKTFTNGIYANVCTTNTSWNWIHNFNFTTGEIKSVAVLDCTGEIETSTREIKTIPFEGEIKCNELIDETSSPKNVGLELKEVYGEDNVLKGYLLTGIIERGVIEHSSLLYYPEGKYNLYLKITNLQDWSGWFND